uniref:ADP,ATP carrier protein n=1 Tax=Alexandrium catenella TaxID=2925 RepID=A0A7S1SF96_ALECA
MNDVFDAEAGERRAAVAAAVGKLLGQLCATFLHSTAAFLTTAGLVAAATAAQLMAPSDRPHAAAGACGAGEQDAAPPPVTRGAPAGFAVIWMLQFAGWVSLCTFSFYFTSVWSEQAGFSPGTPEFDKEVRVACGLLMANAVVFLLAGVFLPAITRTCGGELPATAIGVLVLALVLLSFGWTPRPCAAVATLVAMPVAYQVVTNAPFAWLERQPDFAEAERGRLTGWLNASLAVAQMLTAVATGPLVAVTGGQLVVAFHAVAALDVAVVLALAGVACCGRRRQPAQPLAEAAAWARRRIEMHVELSGAHVMPMRDGVAMPSRASDITRRDCL